MTNSKDPLGQDALLAEASRWFAALDAGTERREAFEAWRSRNPAHAVAYARIAGSWERLTHAPAPAEPVAVSRRGWLKAAAIGLPVVVVGSGLITREAYAWKRATTGVGERQRVVLPDGSVAHLNTDTSLSWRFDEKRRALRLERGEIALAMKQGAAAALEANDTSFPLASGLFDVRVMPKRAELTLVDGATIDLAGNGARKALRRNDAIVVDQSGSHRLETRSAEEVASQIAWRAGEIVFLDQAVGDAAAEFNRYLTRKITLGSATLAHEKIGGRFDLDRPDQFLEAVALSLNARIVRTQDGFELTR